MAAEKPKSRARGARKEPVAPGPAEPPPAPSKPALALMARHRRERHGADFELEQDLYLGGGVRTKTQHLTWNPVTASLSCALCPGELFLSGEITAEMVDSAQRFDPGLRAHLAGLGDPAEREEMTRRYLDGSLNREQLRRMRRPAAARRTRAGHRPEVEERKRRVQAWMLEQYAQAGSLERVLDRAEQQQRDDPAAWLAIAFRPLSRETLRKYWADVDQRAKDRARELFERRSSRS
jgi:hypothetical protein